MSFITQISRERGTSVISTLSFGWMSGLIKLGNISPLDQSQVWKLILADTSAILVSRFATISNNCSLHFALLRLISPLLVYQWSCAVMSSILSFAGPFYLFKVISHIAAAEGGDRIGAVWYLLQLFLLTCVKAALDGQMYLYLMSGISLEDVWV
jgi:hypothetical protein